MSRITMHCPSWCAQTCHELHDTGNAVIITHRVTVGEVRVTLRETSRPDGWSYADGGRATVETPDLEAVDDLGSLSDDLHDVALLLSGDPAQLSA